MHSYVHINRPMQIKVCDCTYNIEYREQIYLFMKPELGFEIVYFFSVTLEM